MPDRPISPALLSQYRSAKRKLANLLREHRNFSRLSRHVDAALGIPRLLQPRRATIEDDRAEDTRRELVRFLQAPDLPPKLEQLRRDAAEWLATTG